MGLEGMVSKQDARAYSARAMQSLDQGTRTATTPAFNGVKDQYKFSRGARRPRHRPRQRKNSATTSSAGVNAPSRMTSTMNKRSLSTTALYGFGQSRTAQK